tara:strand:- start:4788 stop:5561 length:774 start_codon:yes stop_codon:yes gene_type:complete
MGKLRVIARMDIKGPNLIKSIRFEGLRIIGDPNNYALKYYEEGIDEIFILDTVATLYGRNNLSNIIKEAVKNIFIPITAGGGVRSINDVQNLLNSGADKISINTAAVNNPQLISDVANFFGSQCMVLSIEAKKISEKKWEVYTENGREKTGIDVIEWAKKAESLGAGEIILTSVDKDGVKQGFDNELINQVHNSIKVPLIVSGGLGTYNHFEEIIEESPSISGVAIGSAFHYNNLSIKNFKNYLFNLGLNIRNIDGK